MRDQWRDGERGDASNAGDYLSKASLRLLDKLFGNNFSSSARIVNG
jgi:hypothetical protein